MRKKVLYLFVFILFSAVSNSYAQSDNYALRFDANSKSVVCGNINELKGSSLFTLEAWICVDQWKSGARIAQYGENVALELGAEINGELKILFNKNTYTAKASTPIKKGEWHLITMVYQGATAEKITLFVDAKPVTVENATTLPATTSIDEADFSIGNGFIGRIDEIRLWKKSFISSDILLKSTVSPYYNNYADLLGYWKCDQFTSNGLVDYSKGAHHGTLVAVNREKVQDNKVLWYRPITGYINLAAVAQGTLYDKDQLTLCNDIVLFGLTMDAKTGEAKLSYPERKATLTNAEYAATFTAPKSPEGAYTTNGSGNIPLINRTTRDQILRFKGQGAKMQIENLDLNGVSTFETWFYVNTWKEGTALFEKKGTNGEEFSLKMGAVDGEFVFSMTGFNNGIKYTEVYPFESYSIDADAPTTRLSTATTGEHQHWHFLSFVFKSSDEIPVSIYYDGFIQGWPKGGPKPVTISKSKITQNGNPMPKDGISGRLIRKIQRPSIIAGDMVVGRDLDGYMDEISFWAVDRTKAQRQKTDALNVGLDLMRKGAYYTIQDLQAYYPVYDAKEPVKNQMCFKSLLDKMLTFIEGYRGYKIRMTATYTNGSWQDLMKNQTLRDKAATNLVKVLKECPDYKFDGIDIDFEWGTADSQAGYGLFIKKIRDLLGPDALLTVASNGGSSPWYSFTQDAIDAVDFFTSQDYGPHAVKFTYNSFLQMHSNYKAYGIPNNKMMMSYGTYAVGDNYQEIEATPYLAFAESVPDEFTDRILKKDNIYYNFTGIDQTRKRTQYVLDNDLAGLMYYHLTADILPSNPKSLTRSMAQVLASNLEPIVEISNPPTAISALDNDKQFEIYPSPAMSGEIVTFSGINAHELVIYTLEGKMVQVVSIQPNEVNRVKIDLTSGAYIVKADHKSTLLIVK